MINEEELHQKIRSLSNQELLRMVNVDFAQYRQEALDYAKSEIKERGLSFDQAGVADVDHPDGEVIGPVIVGNAGRPRVLAFIVDNLIANIVAFVAVALFKSESPAVSVPVLCFTYLS